MTTYLIFGDGWLGNKFFDYLGDDSELARERIENTDQIRAYLKASDAEVIINCIGKTGKPNIDWCESNKDATFFSNVTVPSMIAEVCEETGKYMVHIGSGCIYQGSGEWAEGDEPNFYGSFYSKTKIFSEKILKTYPDVLTLRIRMPFDSTASPRNLITKLIGYKQVVGDVSNSMTYVPDMLDAASQLMRRRKTGVYNIVNRGHITHREILWLYKELVKPYFELPEFIGVDELKERGLVKALRSNCILSTEKLKNRGIKMRHVEKAMEDCMRKMAK